MVEKYKLAKKSNNFKDKNDRNNRFKRNDRKDYKRAPRKQTSLYGVEVEDWVPKTILSKKVKNGEINSLDEIFDKNLKILDPLIVDYFIKELKEKIIDVKKTSYVRMSGRKYGFRSTVIVGDGLKFIGVGTGKDKDKWQATRKAAKNARLNIIRVKKGCGSWRCDCGTEHSVPFMVIGKAGSVKVKLMPAPQGVGLVVADSIKPVLEFVGIKDVWSKSFGSTTTKLNFVKATVDALQKTNLNMKNKGE